MPRVVETRPQKVRLVVPISSTRAIIVSDDPELIDDENYAPGVFQDLLKAWYAGDYFVCALVNAKGKIIDSISSMAGYGGPLEAAKAARRDHFSG